MNKTFHILTVFIILLSIVTSGLGLLYKTNGEPYNFMNQYGDIVKIYGDGIYKNDSYFMAPIHRGTDFTILFMAIPLLIVSLITDWKNNTLKTKLFLTSIVSYPYRNRRRRHLLRMSLICGIINYENTRG